MIDDPVLIEDWHPIARVEDLAGGGPMAARLLGEDIVLWRSDGDYHAWRDLCVHRGTRLSLGRVVDGARLECPYHGWTYATDGRCVLMPAHPEQAPPAKACVTAYRAAAAHGVVWVTLGGGATKIPKFGLMEEPSHQVLMAGPYRVKASGPRIVENFLDVGHFPFVHEGILGDRKRPEIEEYTATINADGVLAEGVKVFQPDPYGTGEGSVVTYTYRVHRPLTASFVKHGEHSFGMLLSVTPHDAVDSTAWMWMAMNYEPSSPMVEFQDRIFAQDRPILESQRPELLPLDLQAELHLRSDRTAIAYRRCA
ncbi:MAG: aromatic ring-hydroxylating dioxygenase subunit alpha [Chloroflexi bacterium]|nr:MAG: aromatic ring-hydroxylating dioxygenase subunit alpha [Chloroflexota bacterium]